MVAPAQLVKSRADSDTVTRAIQEEILPAFSRERAKLDVLGRVPPEQTVILADLRRYLLLRESYWRQRTAAAGRTDEATLRQLDAADHATDAVLRRLLVAR